MARDTHQKSLVRKLVLINVEARCLDRQNVEHSKLLSANLILWLLSCKNMSDSDDSFDYDCLEYGDVSRAS